MNQEIEVAEEKPDKDARTWGMVCHLVALAGCIIPPFGYILGPLVVWAIKKDDHPFINDQGKEAMNFQLTMTIAIVVCIPLMFLLIGIPLMFIIGIFDLVMIIIASVKANEGVYYRYPVAIRLIK